MNVVFVFALCCLSALLIWLTLYFSYSLHNAGQASVLWLVNALPTEPSDNDGDNGAGDDTQSDDDAYGARSVKAAIKPPSKREQVVAIRQKPFKRVSSAGTMKL